MIDDSTLSNSGLLIALDGPRAFHEKHSFPLDQPIFWRDMDSEYVRRCRDKAKLLAVYGEEPGQEHLFSYRLHLILEELGELISAALCGHTIGFADGVADLLYVVIGLAETYGLPWKELFIDTHRSNMTKQVRTADNLRMRDKGPNYSPPDIKGILARATRLTDKNKVQQQ
jgi:NTP pyrophosphatase (non-canonical NTP hydrolase)